MIVVATKIGAITRTTLTFDQYIYFDPANPDTMICSGKTKIVCINMDFKPCPIPEPILRELDSET
jgi:acyl-CoA thioesterase FadM